MSQHRNINTKIREAGLRTVILDQWRSHVHWGPYMARIQILDGLRVIFRESESDTPEDALAKVYESLSGEAPEWIDTDWTLDACLSLQLDYVPDSLNERAYE